MKILKRINNKILIFSILLGLFIIYFLFESLIQRGANLSSYFITNMNDSYMDYFNMVGNMYDGNPYLRDANYPALGFVIYKILFHLIPPNLNSSNGSFIKGIQAGQLGYLFYFIISIIVFYEVLISKLKGKKIVKLLFAFVIVFSGPFLFQFERANMIFIALIFTMIFVFYYNDENKYKREISYICLAIAVALKIYPVVFGLLLIKKKNAPVIIRTVIYGIFFFFSPFFLFNGIESIKSMVHGILISSHSYNDLGLGYNFSFTNLIKIVNALFGKNIESLPFYLNLLPIIIGLIAFLLSKKLWKKALALCIMMIWFPAFSYTYTLTFFIIPLVLLFNEEQEKIQWVYLFCFVLIFIPYVTKSVDNVNWITGELAQFRLSYGMILINFIIAIMMATLILEGIVNLFKSEELEVYRVILISSAFIVSFCIILSIIYLFLNPFSPVIRNMELYSVKNEKVLNHELNDINKGKDGIIAIWTTGFNKLAYDLKNNDKWIYGKNNSELYLLNNTNRIQNVTIKYEISTGEKELAGSYYYYVKGDTFEEKNALNFKPNATTRIITLNPGINKIVFEIDNSNYYIDDMEKSFKVSNFQIILK